MKSTGNRGIGCAIFITLVILNGFGTIRSQTLEFPEYFFRENTKSDNTSLEGVRSIMTIENDDSIFLSYEMTINLFAADGVLKQVVSHKVGNEIHSGDFTATTSHEYFRYSKGEKRLLAVRIGSDKPPRLRYEFIYDSRGDLVKIQSNLDGRITTYLQYDYSIDGNIVTETDPDIEKKTIWISRNNRWIKKQVMDENGGIEEEVQFYYDRKGFLTKSITYGDDRKIALTKSRFEYKLDGKGNWIRRIEYKRDRWNDRRPRHTNRVIEYIEAE